MKITVTQLSESNLSYTAIRYKLTAYNGRPLLQVFLFCVSCDSETAGFCTTHYLHCSLLSDGNKTTNDETKTKKVQEQDQDWKDRNCSIKSNRSTLTLNVHFIRKFFIFLRSKDSRPLTKNKTDSHYTCSNPIAPLVHMT